jgi:hypothetical protein
MSILFKPQPVTGRLRITMDGVRYDMTRFIKDRSDISAEWDVASNVVTATIRLTIPLSLDIYHIENWQDVYWDSPPITGGVYDRHIRGLIVDVHSDPRTPNHIYNLKVTGGNILLTKPPYLYVSPTTFDFQTATTDKQIVQAILTHCYPVGSPDRIYDDGVNSHYTFHNTPPLTFMGMTAEQALKHLQDYIATNAPGGAQIPAFFVTWRRDDVTSGDNDDWSWVLEWYTESEIGTAAIGLDDQLNEDSTHAHYYGFTRQRPGIQVVNRQVAIGKNPVTHEPITYTADDTTSQTYFGRIISAPPIINDQWTTLTQVQNAAQAELLKWRDIPETLSVGPVFIPYILSAPQKVNFKRSAEGGLSTPTPFALAKVTLAYNAAGTPEYQLQLGTSFPELGERGPGWRGGTNFNTGRSAPAIPVWHPTPADDVLQNGYRGQTRSVTVELTWVPNSEDNVIDYYVQWRLDGGDIVQVPVTAPQSGTPSYIVEGLPPSVTGGTTHTLEMRVRAHNTWGYVSSDWSAWRTPLTLPVADAPVPPTLAFLRNGWERFGSAYFVAAITLAGPAPDHYNAYWYANVGGGGEWHRFVVAGTATEVALKGDTGVEYYLYLKSATIYDDQGGPSNTLIHTIPASPFALPPGPDPEWAQVSGTTPITISTSDRYNGTTFVLAPDASDPVALAGLPTDAHAGQVVVVKLAHKSADSLTAIARLYRYDSDGAALGNETIIDDETTTGDWQETQWESEPLEEGTETVRLYLRSSDALGPSTHYWGLKDWRVRADDIDIGDLTTASKHQYETDIDHPMTTKLLGDGTRPVEERGDQYVSPPTGDAMDPGPGRWTFQAKRGSFYGDARDDTTLGWLDTLGNNTTTSAAGITLSSIAQIRLAGLLALQPTRISGAHTLAAPEGLIFAQMGSDYTLTLPSVVGIDGALVPIIAWRSGLTVHTLTIQPDGTELIDGMTDLELDAFDWVILIADATAGRWHKLYSAGGGGGGADPADFILTGDSVAFSGTAAGTEGRLYYITDSEEIRRDNGTTWDRWALAMIDEPTGAGRVLVNTEGIHLGGHVATELIGTTSPPTLAGGPALGGGGHGTAPILEIAGTDSGGRITVTTGHDPIGDDVLFTCTYNVPYPDYPTLPPGVDVIPRNEAAGKLFAVEGITYWTDLGSSDRYQFTVKVTGPAMAEGVAYTFDYWVWGFPAPLE